MADQQAYKLNPTANEFVPNFGSNDQQPQQQQQQQQQHHQPQQHHQQQQHNYQQNNRNNYRNNNQNYHQQQQHVQGNPYVNQSNMYQQNDTSFDLDPIEIEARCEAVVEILQNESIRQQLNPMSKYEVDNDDSTASTSNNRSNNDSRNDYKNNNNNFNENHNRYDRFKYSI
jgi:hypothetical protein